MGNIEADKTVIDSRKARSAGLWYTISNVALRAISIITAPIFTRLLETSDYGIVNIFSSWQNIFVIFIGLGLSYSIGRAKIDYSEDFDGYLSSIQGLSTVVGILFLVVMIIGQNFFSEVLNLDANLVITLFVYLVRTMNLKLWIKNAQNPSPNVRNLQQCWKVWKRRL